MAKTSANPLQAEIDALKDQLAAAQEQLAKARRFGGRSSTTYSWEQIPITDLIRTLYIQFKQDKGIVNWAVCSLGFPVNPGIVNDMCNRADRFLAISKMSEEEKAQKKENWLKGARDGVSLTPAQKTKLAALFEKVPAGK